MKTNIDYMRDEKVKSNPNNNGFSSS